MNTWSARRKTIYLGIAFLILLVCVAIPTFVIVHKVPTCFDGKQNGDETGVDCGGSCQILCSFEALDPTIIWSRSFKVTNNIYSAAAYIENPNVSSEALAIYTFKFYDANNILIASKSNRTYIPKNKAFAIFEPNIDMQEKVPVRVILEFADNIEWRKNPAAPADLSVSQNFLSNEAQSPRVDADIKNNSQTSVDQIELVSIVYNEKGNAIAASRTFVDHLDKDQSTHVTFTWPAPFETQGASVVEVIPRVIPSVW